MEELAFVQPPRTLRKSALQWMRSMRQLPLKPAGAEKTSSTLPVECESLT
jgi:hypothetical protein